MYVVVLSTQLLISTLVSPILVHILPPAEFGVLASAISLFQLLNAIAVLGIDRAIVVRRSIDGQSPASRYLLSVSFLLSLAVSGAAFASMMWWAPLAGFGDRYLLTTAVVLWTLPCAFVQCSSALLLSEDRIKAFTVVTLVSSVAGPLVGLALIFSFGPNATVYAFGGVAAQVAGAILAVFLTRPKWRRKVARGITRSAIRLGLPLAASGLAYFVLNAGDRLIIQRELGAAAVGRYQVAYVVGSAVLLLLGFLNTSWSPRIIAIRDRSERALLSLASRDCVYAALLPVIAGITLGAPAVLSVVAPASYDSKTLLPVVLIVALSAFPNVSAGATTRMLLADSRGGVLAISAAAAAIVNVVLNLLFIPPMGLVGSALATLIAFVVLAAIQRVALGPRKAWPSPRLRLIAAAFGVTSLCVLALFIPQNTTADVLRFVGAILCVAWFLIAARQIQKGFFTE